MRTAILLVICLLAATGAYAAEIAKTSYAPGELVVIRTTPGATDLAIRFGDQTYRFLGAPEGTTAFSPSEPGEYLIQETLLDGAIAETSFTVVPVGMEIDSGPPLADQATVPQDTLPVGSTDGAVSGVTARPKVDVPTLESDERTLSAVNPGIRVRTARGTGVVAPFTVRPESGGLLKGSTDDLGARLPTGRAEITFDMPERHVTKLTLRGVDMARPVDVGVDDVPQAFVDAPVPDRAWAKVYAVDPTGVSFTDGTLTANATGTELYKCASWEFATRTCPGTWVKLMDLVPGQEYTVTLGPADPGFAEANAQPGVMGATQLTSMRVGGSIPSPVETGANEWGVVVFNPTNRTINVTRISLRASANMFSGATGVVPGSTWTSAANQVNWTGQVTVNPYDAAEFIVNVQGVSSNIANINVEVNATTNDTNLSTTGYQTYTRNAAIQYPSVYFANATGRATYVARNLSPDAVESFIVTVDNGAGASAVPLATSLVIYLPAEWKNVTASAQTGWTLGTIAGDEGAGWLIMPQVATTTIGAGAARNFTFSAVPPDRDSTSVYRVYSLLLGPASNANLAISTTFIPAMQVRNLSTKLLDGDDDRYASTWTVGGSRVIDQYLAVPAPFDSVAASTWGLAVVNPTDDPINVSQIDIQTSSNVFSAVTGIHPAATWSVASASDVRWTGQVTVPPHSTRSFAVNVSATATSTLTTTVTFTTVTNVSTLTTSGFITSMSTGNIQYPSLFALNATGQTFALMNMSPGRSEQFRIRVSNRGSSAAIPIGTALEIYTPSGWTNLSADTQAGWTVVDVHAGSTGGGIVRAIISGTTIGTTASRDFVFNATPPFVGTNSTYRFDIWFFGETGQTTTQIMQSTLQLAANVVPWTYGISLNRTSEPFANVTNISSIAILDVVKANRSAVFNLSILNASSGAFTLLKTGTLGTAEEGWNATLAINRTFDPRDFVNRTTGTVTIKWETASPNMTALQEDLLTINATYDTLLPVIAQNSPAAGAYLNTTALLFSYNASDDIDLRNCSILINGTLNQTNSSPSNSSPNVFNVTVVANGIRTWDIVCYDLNNHVNRTGNRTFTVDTVYPGINLVSPANNTKHNTSIVNFTIVPIDINIANCSLIISGTVNQTNTTPVHNQQVNFTATLPDGNTTWTAECTDLAGNILRNISSRNVQVDSRPPAYDAIGATPASGGTYNASQMYSFSVNWTDGNGISSVVFESNITGTLANRTVNLTSGATYRYNFTTLAAGTYTWRMYANDTFGGWNLTPQQTYTIVRAAANVTLLLNGTAENYPVDVNEMVNITGVLNVPGGGYLEIYVNGTRYATGQSQLQNLTRFTVNGTINVTVVYNATLNYTESNMTLRITVGDKAGPNITQVYPANASYVRTVNVTFRFNLTDATGVENCTLYINGSVNATRTAGLVNDGENAINGTGFGERTYNWSLRCYDPVGNSRNSSTRLFTVDLTPPGTFALSTPPDGTVSRNQSPTLTWQQTAEAHFANYTILIDNAVDFSSPNYVYNATGITNTSYAVNDTLASGTVWNWKVIAYDLAGNSRDSDTAFTYTPDLDPPGITIQSPTNGTYAATTGINITYLISDVSTVANCTLAWNDSTTAVNASLNQSGTNHFIASRTDGTHLFTITCVDIATNEATSDEITLIVDTSPPSPVTLLSPPNGTFSNNPMPLLAWTQTTEPNFANYTVLVSDDPGFAYANHSYGAYDLGTPSYQVVTPWIDAAWWWKVIVYDLAGNSVDPGFLYTLDGTPPTEFSLLTPTDGTASTNRSPTLTWQQSDDPNFDNYTIIVSSAPDLSLVNYTYDRKGSANTTLDIPSPWTDNTIWRWRVIAWDNASNSRNATLDFTYITDNLAPNLTLIAPGNASTLATNSSLITFAYNVTDLSGVSSCTLTINDSAGALTTDQDPFVETDQNQSFVEALTTGDYNWSISCTDLAGNNATSERRMLSVNVTLPRTGFYDTAIVDSPQANASKDTAVMSVYAKNNGSAIVPYYRTWDGTGWSAETPLPYGGSPSRWIRVVANPLLGRADEQVAAVVGDDGLIDGYVWNGTNWTLYANLGDVGTTRNGQRSFDLAYERQRGRAMLLFSYNVNSGAQDLAYRIWNGSAWEPQVNVNDPSSTADLSVSFIRLAMNPSSSSNELAAAYIDVTNSDGRAMVWDGSAWTGFRNVTTAISSTTEESIAIAYEQQRRGALAVAGNGTIVNFAYWNGTNWNQSGTTDINTLTATPTTNWLTLNANPAGNHLMIVGIDSGNDLCTAQWLDGGWTGATRHDATVDGNAQRMADFAWEPDGDAGVLAWGSATTRLEYREYSVASSWFGPSFIATGANTHRWVLGVTVPTALASGTRVLFAAQEANNTLDGADWDGSTLTNQNAVFTADSGAITYQSFDISPEWYAPRPTSFRNISLAAAPDGTGNIIGVWSPGGLAMVSNATSLAVGNLSANGYYLPKGAGVRYSALFESTVAGVSYLTWELYLVNASGETAICSVGNRTRTATATAISATSQATYTSSCIAPSAFLLNTSDTFRAYVWSNASANNTITKTVDSLSTFIQIEGYPVGNLTARIVAPAGDPLIGEGGNLTFICEIACANGYCVNVNVYHQLNITLSAFNDTSYTIGNILLNSSSLNPVQLGVINASVNVSFNLTGDTYSRNNTLRCMVTSDFQNTTTGLRNVSVMDNLAPNVTLVAPPNGTGFDPGIIALSINASDRRLGLCSLWTNTTGAWARNETLTPNNYTYTNFTPINVSAYGTYAWNVNCSDLSGNDTFARTNATFIIAGDVYVNTSDISFLPVQPTEGQNTTIVAVIRNRANRVETNVNVSFFIGDPLGGGVQVGPNITIPTLLALGTASVNVTFNASIGRTPFAVIVDPPFGNGSVFESDETNNLAYANLTVASWQVYYGNVSGNITIASGSNLSFTAWYITNNTGIIYITDTDTLNGISFSSLKALGRNTTGGAPAGSLDDFEQLDAVLNGTNFTDSVNATYTAGGAPVMLGTMLVRGVTIQNVALANSTADGNHTTGILWDADDSLDAVYDGTDKEDVVFVTSIDANRTTVIGPVDYAIRIPSRMNAYRGTTNAVSIFYELA